MTTNGDGSDVDFGSVTRLIGRWAGDKGSDVAPEPDGSEESLYYETILFSAAENVENSESQELVAVHYHQIVSRKSNDKVFHNETGYWMWDAAQGVVMHSLTIPRAVCVLAGGTVKNKNPVVFEVAARLDDPDWSSIQSPFMKGKARTLEFRHKVILQLSSCLFGLRSLKAAPEGGSSQCWWAWRALSGQPNPGRHRRQLRTQLRASRSCCGCCRYGGAGSIATGNHSPVTHVFNP